MLKIENIWKRYVLALSLIAALITTVFVMSETVSQNTIQNAKAINIAGRQRMLSQRIALFSNKYFDHYVASKSSKALSDIRSQLISDRTLFKNSHLSLLNGDLELELSDIAGTIANDIYFEDPHNLDAQVQKYIEHAHTLITAPNLEDKKTALLAINTESQANLLHSLDLVVKRIEIFDQTTSRKLTAIERTSFVLAILLLILEALFIFLPSHRAIRKTVDIQKSLKENKQFQELVLSKIPDLIFVKDSEFRIIEANKAFLNVYPEDIRDTVIGTTTIESYNKEEADAFLYHDKKALKEGYSEVEETIVFPDGIERTLFTQKIRFENMKGNSFILAVARDISVIKKTEDRLRESEERYQLAVRGSSVGLWDWNVLTDELFWSNRFQEIVGISGEGFRPHFKEFSERLHPDDSEAILHALEQHIKNKETYDVEYRLRHNDGHYVWIHARGQAIWDSEDQPTRMAGSVDDITKEKEAEAELLKHKLNLQELVDEQTHDLVLARDAAESANVAKDEFLANMSHELRTPLNSIIGLASVLIESKLSVEQKKSLDVLHRASISLLHTVNDILDTSKIEAGLVKLENKPFRIKHFMSSVLDQVRPLTQQKNILLEDNMHALEECYIIGDEYRLERVIINILGNAIKYTSDGSVRMNAILQQQKDGITHFVCKISDTGIGIPADKLDYIFEKFSQAEESTERRFGGTGLGLNITKRLVKMMNGTIHVSSKEGEGSTFTISIPFQSTDDTQIISSNSNYDDVTSNENNDHKKPIGHAKILVAEDHEFNQVFVQELLKRVHCNHYIIVENGHALIQEMKKNTYDIILMDCHMPEMDGYEATKTIREQEKNSIDGAQPIPIIAMTADAMTGTKEKCFEAGMNEYLSKPIDENKFRTVLSRWFILEDKDKKQTERINNQAKEISTKENPVDMNILQDYANNRTDTLQEIIGIFYKRSLEDLKEMAQHRTDGTNDNWSEAAHNLKGTAGYIGAKDLRGLASEAQNMVDGTAADRKRLYTKIEKEHKKVCSFFRDRKLLNEA